VTSSVYLSRAEELQLQQLSAMNDLKPNEVLRLGLRELAAQADATGRLPLARRDASRGPRAAAPPVDAG